MKNLQWQLQAKAGVLALTMLAATCTLIPRVARAAQTTTGHGQASVILTSKHRGAALPAVSKQDLQLRVNGRPALITDWQKATGPVEMVLLIDNGARSSLGRQMQEIAGFIRSLPAQDEVGIAYMQNGQAVFTVGLTSDKQAAAAGLRLPTGTPGSSASPYFCLSDLAKHWPSTDQTARREVVLFTNGVDNYEPRYNPDDPYVQAAIADALRAHLVVNSIYWSDSGWFNRTGYAADTGQNLLLQVAAATGGKAYWQGMGNPVTFAPYFKDLRERLSEQYALDYTAPLRGKPQMVSLKLRVEVPGVKVEAPQQGWLTDKTTNQESANDSCCSLHPKAAGAHLGW